MDMLTSWLYKKCKKDIVPPAAEALARVGLPENEAIAAQATDRAITRAKDVQGEDSPGILPVTPVRYKKILVIPAKGAPNPAAAIFGGGGTPPWEVFAEELRKAGFEVELYESMIDKLPKMPEAERAKNLMGMYAGKAPIKDFAARADLIINVAQVVGGMQPVERVGWPASKGTPDVPWYVHEVPTILVSVSTPFLLADAPTVKCVINAYDARPDTIKATVAKLIQGVEAFKGCNPVDVFCGFPDTRL